MDLVLHSKWKCCHLCMGESWFPLMSWKFSNFCSCCSLSDVEVQIFQPVPPSFDAWAIKCKSHSHSSITLGTFTWIHWFVCSWFCSHLWNCPSPTNIDLHGIKGQKSSPYHDRPPISHHTNSTMTSFTKCNIIFTNDGPFFYQCWATSPSRTTSSCKSSLRGLQWDFCWNHRKLVKIWASRIAFSPD